MGMKSREYIGNGGLISGNKVIVAREVVKDYLVILREKNLYGYAPKGVPNKNIAQVLSIKRTIRSYIAVAQVSRLFQKTVLNYL